MYPDKTYTRKISISILKCSTLCTRPTLRCRIYSVNPPSAPFTHRDGLYLSKGGAVLSLLMYGFCSNKALYSAILSFTMFIGPAAGARRVLQKRVCPSFLLSGQFHGIGSLVFSKFWCGARNPNEMVHVRTRFFQNNFFCLKHW